MPYRNQKDYLPSVFENLYLGITLEEFKKIKDTTIMDVDESEYVSYLTEFLDKKDFKYLVYQFDKHKILYEMIIEFQPGYDIDTFIKNVYGQPNNNEEWLIDGKDGFQFKIWKFINSLCIANASYFV